MCGIFGFFNFENNLNEIKKAMSKINYRGQDSCGIYIDNNIYTFKNLENMDKLDDDNNNTSNFILGHLLHSIVNFIPQPIKNEGILISNCEIYNWEKLNKEFNFNTKNDSKTLLNILDKFEINNIREALDLLDGTYSFAYLRDNTLILTRDLLGIKPLFYYNNAASNKFAFASEKKALPKNAVELEPTKILYYNLKDNSIKFVDKQFYSLGKEHQSSYDIQKEKTKKLLLNAIRKRIPQGQKIGLLFSGGVDSTFIAIVLKKLGIDFTCYTAKVEGGKIQEAPDLIYAKRIAKDYNLDLKIATVKTTELESVVVDVIKTIEDRNYIKTSVALPFYLACQQAKADGVKVMFSGLGSEEIFAGYNRHKKVEDANQECLEGLKILYIRDLYRDDVITMANNVELRLPFLDKELIKYALNIPVKYKLSEDKIDSKLILRDIAKELGLADEYAMRQKKAAQYGSKFDKGLLRLAKDFGGTKEEYMNSLDVGDIDKIYYNN